LTEQKADVLTVLLTYDLWPYLELKALYKMAHLFSLLHLSGTFITSTNNLSY